MNWLLGAVVILLVIGTVLGFFRGAIMMVYSVISWLVALLVVSLATPIISAAIISGTTIDEGIEEQTVVYLREYVQEHGSGTVEKADQKLGQEELSAFGIRLPSALVEQLTGAESLPDLALENMGIYERIASYISRLIIQGATFLIVLFVVRIVLFVAGRTLKSISKLEGIRQLNRVAGATLGCLEALLIVWIAFAGIAFISASAAGQEASELIYASVALRLLYENNPLLTIAGSFM